MLLRHFLGVLFLLGFVGTLHAEDGPLPPKVAPLKMTLPEGFKATLFAGEPDVVQPIAFAFDDRGRLWVAECYSYPKLLQDPKAGRDRILIFEDTDGDGQFDKRTVFHSNLANVSGIQFGFGGVWVCATPHLLFIPDRNGDDVPDGPAEIVLDGWDLKNSGHNMFNSLTWGPDGWLYGCNGIQSKSNPGRPGAPDAERAHLDCGIWRIHPVTKKVEAVAWGTTNPWGLDFDAYGQMFMTNCVIEHIWHVVPGAHFKRMYGQDLNPHVYGYLGSIADHIHWAGGDWTTSRGGKGEHGDAGGGHAHVGAMIYLGDNWPEKYRGGAFMCNLHGNRVNHDTLKRKGSTYTAQHAPDFLFANDPWFRGIAIHAGPDGGVFVCDWTDTGECHNYKVVDQTNGRIFKVFHGTIKHQPIDLAKLSDAELVKLNQHPNDWHGRHARRILQERAAEKKLDKSTITSLKRILLEDPNEIQRLRALWTLHCIDGLDLETLNSQMRSTSEVQRSWGIRLSLENPRVLTQLEELAETDRSPFVRLHLASGLQRLPIDKRWPIVERLLQSEKDSADLYLPLMIWYGIEPLAAVDPVRASKLLAICELPIVREYLSRRLSSLPDSRGIDPILVVLRETTDATRQRDILRGMQEAFKGQRQVSMPKGWSDAYPPLQTSKLPEVREKSLALAVQFGDARALKALHEIALDPQRDQSARQSAFTTLIQRQGTELKAQVRGVIDDPVLRSQAIRALANFDDPSTPDLLLKRYTNWNPAEKSDALATLASRPAFAKVLIQAVEAGTIPRNDVGAYTVRQLHALNQPDLTERLQNVWGTIRPTSEQKVSLMVKYQGQLNENTLKKADLIKGRVIYTKVCASCHRLFGEGGDIGPELTGSQRTKLDYVLENILDPNALVPKEYQMTIVETKRGVVITGIIKQETDKALTIQTPNDKQIVPLAEIENRRSSPLSMMPDNLLDTLRIEEVRDLIAYLASPQQVPLKAK